MERQESAHLLLGGNNSVANVCALLSALQCTLSGIEIMQRSNAYTDMAVRNDIATGTHMQYGITQCYVPPDRGDIPAYTPAEAGTLFSAPGWMDARLS